jgi:hypothetical protein
MTRRERLERKIEKRRDWADKATAQSTQAYNHSHNLVAGIPMGQPILVGHHSEKRHRRTLDRSWNALGKSVGLSKKADMHESKASNLEHLLDKAIFTDDDDATEALKQRIAANEAKREQMKLVNKLYKKGDADGLKALGLDLDTLKAKLAAAGGYWGSAPHLAYELTNLGARIRSDKERLVTVARVQQRTAQAEAAPNGVTIEKSSDGAYCSVTFAEKPERSVLNALRDAGFHWGRGSWSGQTAKLPAAVEQLLVSTR